MSRGRQFGMMDIIVQEQREENRIAYTTKIPYVRTVRVVREKLSDGCCVIETKFNYIKSQDFLKGFNDACDKYKGYLVELVDMSGEVKLSNGVIL